MFIEVSISSHAGPKFRTVRIDNATLVIGDDDDDDDDDDNNNNNTVGWVG